MSEKEPVGVRRSRADYEYQVTDKPYHQDIKAKYDLNFDDLQKNFQAAYEALHDDPEWEPADELPPPEDE